MGGDVFEQSGFDPIAVGVGGLRDVTFFFPYRCAIEIIDRTYYEIISVQIKQIIRLPRAII